jgi:hypothetical protein
VGPATIGALIGTAKGQLEPFAEVVLARGPDDTSIDAAHLTFVKEVARQCPAEVCSAMLAYAYDFRPFIAALPDDERGRMTALVAEGDQVFGADALHAVWRQAGVRSVGVPGEGHALFLRAPDRFRALLLDCLATSTAGR